MTTEGLLDCLASLDVPGAEQLQTERAEAREMQAASKKALVDAAVRGRSNDGRRNFQTLLTAAAYDGDGPSKITAKRKAEILGVHPDHFTAARQRAKILKPELSMASALDEGAYWYHSRSRRNDTNPNQE